MHATVTSRSRFLAGIVVVALFAGVALTGGVAAQNATDNATTTDNGTDMTNETMAANATANASLTAETTTAGTTANHTLTVTIGETTAGNLTGVAINYTAANASTRPALDNDLLSIEGPNGSIPIGTDANATIQATGFRLAEFTLDLNQSLQPATGDQLEFAYPVENPSEPGNYTVGVVLNPERNDSANLSTNLTITPNETTPAAGDNGTTMVGMDNGTTTGMVDGTETTGMMDGNETTGMMDGTETTAEETPTEEDTPTDEDTPTEAAGTTTTSGNGPGFTAFAALVAVLAAALLATRRS